MAFYWKTNFIFVISVKFWTKEVIITPFEEKKFFGPLWVPSDKNASRAICSDIAICAKIKGTGCRITCNNKIRPPRTIWNYFKQFVYFDPFWSWSSKFWVPLYQKRLRILAKYFMWLLRAHRPFDISNKMGVHFFNFPDLWRTMFDS